MAEEPPTKKKCLGVDCENDASSLQCPKCLSLGIKDSFFCSQDCFKKNWVRQYPTPPSIQHFSKCCVLTSNRPGDAQEHAQAREQYFEPLHPSQGRF